MLDPIKNLIGWLLSLFYALPPHNLGIAIILMTVTVMAVMLPLTAKQVRSMVAMQKLQPEIKRLQTMYKDDRQKQSEEIMKFYKENQINPLAGCLPLLVQMPIYIALYGTLKDIPNHVAKSSRLFVDLCGDKTASACAKAPARALEFLGMNLRWSLFEARKTENFLGLLPYGLLVAFVIATGVVQTRQTMARQKRQNPDAPVNPQMQTMMRIMPLLNVMTAFFPVGVAIYWGARNVWLIAQQQFVLNRFYADATPVPKGASTPSAKPQSKAAVEAPKPARTNPNTSKKKQQRRKR